MDLNYMYRPLPKDNSIERRRALPGLQAITLENFKGIGSPVTIPLRRLTLLFGPNSAGKSTVIQALQYAWEILDKLDADLDRTRKGGLHVSLGGFKNMVHNRDTSKEIGITLHYYGSVPLADYATNKDTFNDDWFDFDPTDLDLSWRFGHHSNHWAIRIGIRCSEEIRKVYVANYAVELNFEPLAHIDDGLILHLNVKHPSFRELMRSEKLYKLKPYLEAIERGHADDYTGLSIEYDDYADAHPEVSRIIYYKCELDDKDRHQAVEDWEDTCIKRSLQRAANPAIATGDSKDDIPPAPVFDMSDLRYDFKDQSFKGWTYPTKYTFRAQLDHWSDGGGVQLVLWGNLLSFDEQFSITNWDAEDGNCPEHNSRMPEEYKKLQDGVACILTQLVLAPGKAIRDELAKQTYLGPLRKSPEREFQIELETIPDAWWADGRAAWDILKLLRGNFERLNEHLAKTLRLPYQLRYDERILLPTDSKAFQALIDFINNYDSRDGTELKTQVLDPLLAMERLSKIKLLDTATGVEVEPKDIGIGIAQVLPVVVGLLFNYDCLFAVEQPELHMHPAVQSRLGDLLVHAALGKRDLSIVTIREGHLGTVLSGWENRINPRFVLETHSEHIILRILRRIRETSAGILPDGIPNITPNDVQVVYINKNAMGETMVHLQEITPDGDFTKDWPDGFFDERDEDLF